MKEKEEGKERRGKREGTPKVGPHSHVRNLEKYPDDDDIW